MLDNNKIKSNKSAMDKAMDHISTNMSATKSTNTNASKTPVNKNLNSDNNINISISGMEEADAKEILNKENTAGFKTGGPLLGEDMLDAGMDQQDANEILKEDNLSEEREQGIIKGEEIHQQFMDAKASLYAENSKSDSRRMGKLKSALNELFPANGVSVLEEQLPESSRSYQIKMGEIRKKYAKAIKKLEEYVKNRQKPRSSYGKVRLQRVETLLDIARKDARFFVSGAENSAYIKQFKETYNRMPTWGELLREARSYKANLDDTTGGQSAQAKKFKEDNVTYFFKKDVVTYSGGMDGAIKKILKNKKTDPSVAEYDRQLESYKNQALFKSIKSKFKKVLKTLAPGIKALYEDDYNSFTEDSFYSMVHNLFTYNFDAVYYKNALNMLEKINRCIGQDESLTKLININKPYDINASIDENTADDTLNIQKNITEFKNKYSSSILMSGFAEAHNLKGGISLDMRNVAASRMADLLGIGDLVMKSRSATLNKADGTTETGVLMEDVGGISLRQLLLKKGVKRNNIRFTRKAGMDMAKLMLFDILCCQTDRHSGNLHIHYTEKNGLIYITKIVGIDNDLSFSDFELGKTEKTSAMMNPSLFNRDHSCIFEYMDKSLYDNLMTLNIETIKLVLADCQISKSEFNAIEKRLKTIKKELRRKKQERENAGEGFLVNNAETYFDEDTELTDIMPHMGNVYHSKEVDGFTFDLVMADAPIDKSMRNHHTTIANNKLVSESDI